MRCSGNVKCESIGSILATPLLADVAGSSSDANGSPRGLASRNDDDGSVTASGRKLAFHEPRPCPVCKRVYRDAATLRTHTAIMHTDGATPFFCSCGSPFRTKYEMYVHKKNGHKPGSGGGNGGSSTDF